MTHRFHSLLKMLVSAPVNSLPKRAAQRHLQPQLSTHVGDRCGTAAAGCFPGAAMLCPRCAQRSSGPSPPHAGGARGVRSARACPCRQPGGSLADGEPCFLTPAPPGDAAPASSPSLAAGIWGRYAPPL